MAMYVYPSGVETPINNMYIGEYPPKRHPGTNTMGYYAFDDQNANQITDLSGNNRNLT